MIKIRSLKEKILENAEAKAAYDAEKALLAEETAEWEIERRNKQKAEEVAIVVHP
jgi:hypothetical protein